jgi:hypothetical protein
LLFSGDFFGFLDRVDGYGVGWTHGLVSRTFSGLGSGWSAICFK